MVYTPKDHRNDAIKCLEVCGETTRLPGLWFQLSFDHSNQFFLDAKLLKEYQQAFSTPVSPLQCLALC